MAYFEDGSYSSLSGIELIAKVLAGRCTMHYTRVAVGKGEIPEGGSPKTMPEPAGYVMDARIAAVTNPVNGECQVTVQINSSDVEHGFYCTGLLLYAEDPDKGEVPYTYLVLENGPEWIRPSSSAVGKLATFDLIAAVGDVDRVTASIDPDSIMTYEIVEQLIAQATVKKTITLPTDGWQQPEAGGEGDDEEIDTYGPYYDAEAEGVTAEMVPMVTIHPDSLSTARECELCMSAKTIDGAVRFFTRKEPTSPINVTLTLLCASNGTPGGGGGGGEYVLPTATATRLGGVKVGSNLRVKQDGTLSADIDDQLIREELDEVTATETDVKDTLDDILPV